MGIKFWIGQHLRIEVRSREHGPPHVHALAKGAEAVIDLRTLEIEHCEGFNRPTLKEILKWISEHRAILLEAWDYEQEQGS